MTTDSTFEKEDSTFELGEVEEKDIPNLVPVIQSWVKSDGEVIQEEVEDIVRRLEGAVSHTNGYTYEVVRDEEGKAIGMAGLRDPEPSMEEFKSFADTKSAELVNVFLSPDYRGKGLGHSLLNATFDKAKGLGYTEVIWNSGPRYRFSGWSFYKRTVGEPVAIANAYYGYDKDGTPRNAPVWRKKLE